MVKLNKITTKTGDKGQSKFKKKRMNKNDSVFDILGDLDELNASIGFFIALNKKEKKINIILLKIQNKLFDIGAEFLSNSNFTKNRYKVGINELNWIEKKNESFNKNLDFIDSFILPGGDSQSAYLHVTRTICRRVERNIVNFYTNNPNAKNDYILAIFNRLSDLFFNLSRYYNKKNKINEILWIPNDEL